MSTGVRLRSVLVAGVTAVVIGAGFMAVGIARRAADAAAVPRPAGNALTQNPSDGSAPFTESLDQPSPSALVSVLPTHSGTSPKTASPTPTATRKPTSKPPTSVPVTEDAILVAVLAHINAARSDKGLSRLTFDSKLAKASALHTGWMMGGCGLSHKCSGESAIGTRITAQGVKWTAAGENIGCASSGASKSAVIKAANGLTNMMLAEKAPDDGHRKNLLNSAFKRIGLSVVRDSKGVTWMTQDFVN